MIMVADSVGCLSLSRFGHIPEMKDSKGWKIVVLTLASLIAVYLAVAYLPSILGRLGRGDYIAYWSASYLLARGENFADDTLMLKAQGEISNSTRDFPIKAWNPPWLLVWLLPYTFVDFNTAASLWLLTNLILLCASSAMLWRLYASSPYRERWFGLTMLGAVLFPFALTALVDGQVNFIVLFGLACFLFFYRSDHYFSSGLALSLTMVKPQLVFLTIPLVLFDFIRKRNWAVLLGFMTSLTISTLIALVFRPTLLGDYFNSTSNGNLLAYLSPTLPVILSLVSNAPALRFIGLLLLPVALFLIGRFGERFSIGVLVDLSLIASIITAPFLWSYDFVVLLVPLIHIWAWIVSGTFNRNEISLFIVGAVVLDIWLYKLRIQTPSEIYYAWFPLLVAGLYGFVGYRIRQMRGTPEVNVLIRR